MAEAIKNAKAWPSMKAHTAMARKREQGFTRNWVSMNMMVNFQRVNLVAKVK